MVKPENRFAKGFDKLDFNSFFHFFHNCECCRANCCIIEGKAAYLMELFPVGMREFPAGFWAYFINTTSVVYPQKTTWQFAENIVFIFVDLQVFAYKFSGFRP